MVFALVDHHAQVMQREAGHRAVGQRLADALLDRRDELARNGAADDLVDELEASATFERLDPQEHLAELAGPAGLLLVAVVPLGGLRDRLAVGDARRPGRDVHVIALGHALEHHAQVQLAHAIQHGLVHRREVLDVDAGILGHQLVERLGQPLLLAAPLRLDRHAEHRRRELDGLEVEMILLVRVVQHGIEVQLVELRHRTDVARHGLGNLDGVLALQPVEVRELDRLARIADEQLGAGSHGALVHAEDAELADERVDGHLEHVGDDVAIRVGPHLDTHRSVALALQERRRIAFRGVRHQPCEHVEQLRDTRTGLGRDEADRDEVALAQALLEGIVQLLRPEILALLEVNRHQVFVDLDHLVDDLGMRRRHRREVGVAPRRLEEHVEHLLAARSGQVERQALLAETLAQLLEHFLGPRLRRIDAIDDDQPAQAAIAGEVHHALGHRLDAGHRADHHGRGLDRLEHAERATDEVRDSWRIDQVDLGTGGLEVTDRRIERMQQLLLLRVEVADRAATIEVALGSDRAGPEQERLRQQRLARRGVAYEGDVADVRGRVTHGLIPPGISDG